MALPPKRPGDRRPGSSHRPGTGPADKTPSDRGRGASGRSDRDRPSANAGGARYDGARHDKDRAGGERKGGGHFGDRQRNDRARADRPAGDKPGYDPAAVDRLGGNRFGQDRADRAGGDRSGGGRSAGGRFNADRAGGERGGGRFNSERGGPERTENRDFRSNRGPAERTAGDRPAGERTGRDRAGSDRAGADRTPQGRPGRGRMVDAPAAHGRATGRDERGQTDRRGFGGRDGKPRDSQSRDAGDGKFTPRGAFVGRGGVDRDRDRPRNVGPRIIPAPRVPKPRAEGDPAAVPAKAYVAIPRDGSAEPREGERIAKLLARAGVASRREIERMIAEGRIRLGPDLITTPATVLTSLRGVTVDGHAVRAAEAPRLFAFHKPAGLLTAERDMAGRPTIYTALRNALPPGTPRLMPVGRLDLNTEGLLLLTNDGELKRAMELPSSGVPRTYRARTFGDISQNQLEELIDGIEIEGMRYGRIDANMERRTGRNQWIEMTLTEGKNREVRRVLEHLGLQVSRLIRTEYGPFALADLERGQAVAIQQAQVERFYQSLLSAKVAPDLVQHLPAKTTEGGETAVEAPVDPKAGFVPWTAAAAVTKSADTGETPVEPQTDLPVAGTPPIDSESDIDGSNIDEGNFDEGDFDEDMDDESTADFVPWATPDAEPEPDHDDTPTSPSGAQEK